MTIEETIKALEQCSTGKDCKGCPYLYDEVRFRCHQKQLMKDALEIIRQSQGEVKRVLEKVWDSTFAKEVGTRWILLQIAKEEGVKLDRELKRYGEKSKIT